MRKTFLVAVILGALTFATTGNAGTKLTGARSKGADNSASTEEAMASPTWGFVGGRVIDQKGDGVKDALVELWKGEAMLRSVTTDGHGMYELHMIPAGSYALRIVDSNGTELASPPLYVARGVNAQRFIEVEREGALRQARTPASRKR